MGGKGDKGKEEEGEKTECHPKEDDGFVPGRRGWDELGNEGKESEADFRVQNVRKKAATDGIKGARFSVRNLGLKDLIISPKKDAQIEEVGHSKIFYPIEKRFGGE